MVTMLLALFLAVGPGAWKLPANARITMETAHIRKGYSPNYLENCAKRRITEQQLRHMFATYHELHEMEEHDGYEVEGCVIEGDILVGGKRFRYIQQPIHLLQTTWPDGKPHELGGGKHSDQTDDGHGRR